MELKNVIFKDCCFRLPDFAFIGTYQDTWYYSHSSKKFINRDDQALHVRFFRTTAATISWKLESKHTFRPIEGALKVEHEHKSSSCLFCLDSRIQIHEEEEQKQTNFLQRLTDFRLPDEELMQMLWYIHNDLRSEIQGMFLSWFVHEHIASVYKQHKLSIKTITSPVFEQLNIPIVIENIVYEYFFLKAKT